MAERLDVAPKHTATVENKRLGHALKIVKLQQEITRAPKVMSNSAKGGYKRHPRQLYGPDYKAELAAPKAVEITA